MPQNPRFIRAKDLKRIYGITARVLAGVADAPKPIKVSRKVVLFRIADLDVFMRSRESGAGGRSRGGPSVKKINSNIDTQEDSEKINLKKINV